MRRFTSDHCVTEMSRDHPPVYSMKEGEKVIVEMLDCHGGYVGRDGRARPGQVPANPATGPIEVKGSQPGEAIAVTFHQLRPADWGFIGGGGEPFTVVEITGETAVYPWGLRLPTDPMVGVVGLAPAGAPVPTNTPGDHGGNLDVTDVGAGATLFLPVAVPGGLLALGDTHALQGDGECGGTGIECAAEAVISVRRVAQPLCELPCLIRDDELMVLAAAETLDEAAWKAVGEMAKVLARLTGLSDSEARRLLSTAGDLRISQIVNPKKACRAVIPRVAIADCWPF